MQKFTGTHSISVDEKGRCHIPKKFQDLLEKTFYGPNVVVWDKGECWKIFPKKEFDDRLEGLDQLSQFNPVEEKKLRKIYSRIEESQLKSGKILLPSTGRKASGLDREAILLGVGNAFEIWEPGNYNAYLEREAQEENEG